MAIRGKRWSRRRLQPPPPPPYSVPGGGLRAGRHSAPELMSEPGGTRHPNLHKSN